MLLKDMLVVLILGIILGFVISYIIKEKKKGTKCIGCQMRQHVAKKHVIVNNIKRNQVFME